MKFMSLGLALALAFSTTIIAARGEAGPLVSGGIGPLETYAECTGNLGDDQLVNFEVRSTALVTLIQGLLYSSDSSVEPVNFKCEQPTEVSTMPAQANKVLWKCAELRNGDGKTLVEISQVGRTGLVEGKIMLEQIFPLPPQVVGTLDCQSR